jgi:hypothetical protein
VGGSARPVGPNDPAHDLSSRVVTSSNVPTSESYRRGAEEIRPTAADLSAPTAIHLERGLRRRLAFEMDRGHCFGRRVISRDVIAMATERSLARRICSPLLTKAPMSSDRRCWDEVRCGENAPIGNRLVVNGRVARCLRAWEDEPRDE